MDEQSQITKEQQDLWHKTLTEGHRSIRFFHRLFRYLPGPPRCKVCHNPFGGVGGKIIGLIGFKPSRKNPMICSMCCEKLPAGGAELDVAILFADIRGSTILGERLGPTEFASQLNRFYSAATEVLIRRYAIIDKLIGDEVMALFIPGICGADYRLKAAEAALALLDAVGYGDAQGPWMPIGVAINSGMTYVGNVGPEGVVDFTALGDTVNTASRLAASAAAGEILMNADIYETVAGKFPQAESRTLSLRGKEAPFEVHVLRGGS
jgi:adenylate cyclase